MKFQQFAVAFVFATASALSAAGPINPGQTISNGPVLGTASIYHVFGRAGNTGGDYGPDSAAVLFSFSAGTNNVFSIVANGLVGCCSNSPYIPADGSSSSTSIGGINGLSGISGDGNIPLVGVFTSDIDPYGSAPPSVLNFNKNAPSSLSPLLNQVFYVGDGRSGYLDPNGTSLTFTAPSGATRLYLGVVDAYSFGGTSGYYSDNYGAFTATVTLAPVPELETYAMMLAGLGLLGAAVKCRKAKQA